MNEERDIRVLTLEEAWRIFLIEREIDQKGKSTYEKVRYGVLILFDIYDYFNDILVIKGKVGEVIYRTKKFGLKDLWTELERREEIIKQYLIELEPKKAFKSW